MTQTPNPEARSAPRRAAPSGGTGDTPVVLAARCMPLPATFSFACYDTPFDAVVSRADPDGARLTVRGVLGVLPFSAEAPVARRNIRSVVRAGRDLPYAEITLTRDQSIVVRGTMDFAHRPSPATVAAAATVMVIAVKPFIDMISTFRSADRAGGRAPARHAVS